MGVQRVLLFVLLGCLLTLLLASTSTPSQSADGSASSPLPEAVKGSAETAETTENATELHAGDGAFNVSRVHLKACDILRSLTKKPRASSYLNGVMGEDTTLRDALSAAVADVLSDALKISALTSENDIQRFADELPEIADSDEDNDKVIKAVTVLKRLGYQLRHAKSISFLADAFLFGQSPLPVNTTIAFKFYNTLSHHFSNSTAQFLLGFMYSQGVGTTRDQPRALIYYTFAALSGYTPAEQTMAYRYMYGIDSPKKCTEAAAFYSQACSTVLKMFYEGPPLGRPYPESAAYLPDDVGGVYGKASAIPPVSSKMMKGEGALSDDDILQWYQYTAERGDPAAQYYLGYYYYRQHQPPAYRMALKYFQAAAQIVLSSQSGVEVSQQHLQASSQAAYMIGKLHWRGEGLQQDNTTARRWFERASQFGDSASDAALGIMYFEGTGGMARDVHKAKELWERAIKQGDDTDANVYLGNLKALAQPVDALQHFQRAAKYGHIMAYFRIGQMILDGRGALPRCDTAVTYFKKVVEKGNWFAPIFSTSMADYEAGNFEGALIKAMINSERGIEVDQVNAAWMLETDVADLDMVYHRSRNASTDRFAVAIEYWRRAADQGYVDGRTKVGDYYYYGLGMSARTLEAEEVAPSLGVWESILSILGLVPTDTTRRDYVKAAKYYHLASDEHSALAMFNMGYMHEHGLGVERDFFLAKRFYDRSLAANPDAYLAVAVALLKLVFKLVVYTAMGFQTYTPQEKVVPEELPILFKKGDEWNWDEWWNKEGEEVTELFESTGVLVLCIVAAVLVWYRGQIIVREQQDAQVIREDDTQRPMTPATPTTPTTPTTLAHERETLDRRRSRAEAPNLGTDGSGSGSGSGDASGSGSGSGSASRLNSQSSSPTRQDASPST